MRWWRRLWWWLKDFRRIPPGEVVWLAERRLRVELEVLGGAHDGRVIDVPLYSAKPGSRVNLVRSAQMRPSCLEEDILRPPEFLQDTYVVTADGKHLEALI